MELAAACFGLLFLQVELVLNQDEGNNSYFHIPILAHNLKASAGKITIKRNLTFQYDNHTKHTSKSTKEMLY